MQRYLAIHSIPAGTSEASFRTTLERIATAADGLGVNVKETLFNLRAGRAWSLFEAANEEEVREVASVAGLPVPEVVAAELVYTELLRQPHRAR